jgi:hypothetical protein
MKSNKIVQKLMTKWKITSLWDFTAIMLVFSLAGMFVVRVRKPFFVLIGITKETPFVIKFFCWLLIIFPSYQLGLLIFGFLLGQFSFFWEKEKQMFRAIKRLFSPNKVN